jgi:DNA-binding MarR family transcriptional regulator
MARPSSAEVHTLTPQIVGQAEKAHKPFLDVILGRTATTMNQWVALKVTATSGGAADRRQLQESIAGALRIDDAMALAAITELTTAGLLTDRPGETAHLEFTAAGRERYEQIDGAVREVLGRAYSDIPAEDLETAAWVLTVITNRLNTEQA